jgi:hypothetical protein
LALREHFLEIKKILRSFLIVLFTIHLLTGCVSMGPEIVEEAVNPDSPVRKVAAYHVHKWTSRPITALEKRFDFNHNGVLDPGEQLRFHMAQGFYRAYGNVWKYDKNKDWHFDQEEYNDAGSGNW